ncbi:hypothetical protein ACN38_g7823 [Penicillium nordicum]|uniref:Uncharacterized protein n=1 Tax=Penicillium nordicum TaxID=229535 RepID=A0A0M9WE07_9EURO|nr:hypothetical protein ACN38_g7823 [Penicillium nordicum]
MPWKTRAAKRLLNEVAFAAHTEHSVSITRLARMMGRRPNTFERGTHQILAQPSIKTLTCQDILAEVCLGHWWVKVRSEKGQRAGQGSGCNVGYETVDRGGEKGHSLPPETPIQWVGRAS